MTDTPNVDRLIARLGRTRRPRIAGVDVLTLYRELVAMREKADENYRATVREAMAKPPTLVVTTEEFERLRGLVKS